MSLIRTVYNDKYKRSGIVFNEPSMCQQQFKSECDIHSILDHYKVTGVLPERQDQPMYGDFSSVSSFMDAQEVVLNAKAQFESLPSELRKRFGNDPAEFLAFVSDEANLEESYRLGIRYREIDNSSLPVDEAEK